MRAITGLVACLLLTAPLWAVPARADDASAGVEPPRLTFAPDDLVKRQARVVALDGHRAAIRMSLVGDTAPLHLLGAVATPAFTWRGAGDPYPDRQYPELAVLVDGRPAPVHVTATARTDRRDVTALLRAARVDPFAIAETPPIVDLSHASPAAVQALREADALRSDADAGDLGLWTAQRQLWFGVPAGRLVTLELRYLARPGFALRSTSDAALDATLGAYCTSVADVRARDAQALAGESVIVEEFVFDVAVTGNPRDAAVALALRADKAASRTLYAACGADAASRLGVGSLAAAGVVDAQGHVHVLALSGGR